MKTIWTLKLRIQRAILVAASLTMTGVIFFQVVSRYILNTSVYGLEDLAAYVAVWFYFIGAAHGGATRSHISASLTDLIVTSPRRLAALRIVTTLFSAVMAAWVCSWSIQYMQFNLMLGARSPELKIPLWPVHLAMPVGLGLMAFYFAIEFIDHLRGFMGNPDALRDEARQRDLELQAGRNL